MRIYLNYAHIYIIKTKLNLTIEDNVLTRIKLYAQKKQVSVSELVENYFESLIKPTRHPNILDVIDRLGKPAIDKDIDLKKSFYEDQSNKYGF